MSINRKHAVLPEMGQFENSSSVQSFEQRDQIESHLPQVQIQSSSSQQPQLSDMDVIQQAFQADPDLAKDLSLIYQRASTEDKIVLKRTANFVNVHLRPSAASPRKDIVLKQSNIDDATFADTAIDEPIRKKQRIGSDIKSKSDSLNGTGAVTRADPVESKGSITSSNSDSERTLLEEGSTANFIAELTDISVIAPVRRKCIIAISDDELIVSAVSKNTNQQVQVPSRLFSIKWRDVAFACCVSAPDKIQAMRIYCIFGRSSVGIQPSEDSLAFTLVGGIDKGIDPNDRGFELHKTLIERLLLHQKQLSVPVVTDISSSQGRKNATKKTYIDAHRGTKSGSLLFFDQGIMFGFKKPIMFVPLQEIKSINYSSIVERTFSFDVRDHDDKTVEFSMIDQATFESVDQYCQEHSLLDLTVESGHGDEKSSSFQRQMQRPSELQKAEQMITDRKRGATASNGTSLMTQQDFTSEDEETDASFEQESADESENESDNDSLENSDEDKGDKQHISGGEEEYNAASELDSVETASNTDADNLGSFGELKAESSEVLDSEEDDGDDECGVDIDDGIADLEAEEDIDVFSDSSA